MIGELAVLILLGFSLGLVHAFDADHVMAVSVLSNTRPGLRKTLRHCAHWALGHGFILISAGLLLFGLGIAIPESLVWLAEVSVGVFLIGMGLFCFWRFRRERIVLVEHQHGDVTHRHWQIEGDQTHARASASEVAEGGKEAMSEGTPFTEEEAERLKNACMYSICCCYSV